MMLGSSSCRFGVQLKIKLVSHQALALSQRRPLSPACGNCRSWGQLKRQVAPNRFNKPNSGLLTSQVSTKLY